MNQYITNNVTPTNCSFWEPSFVSELLVDRTAKNLLYIEALMDVRCGHMEISSDARETLASLQKKGLKKEVSNVYIRLPTSKSGMMRWNGFRATYISQQPWEVER